MRRALATSIAAGLTLAAALVMTMSHPARAEAAPFSRVALYGDSLAVEAQDFFVFPLAGSAEVRTHTFGGTAICDWFDAMHEDAAWAPEAVVIEFSGNALTPCMRDLAGNGLAGDDHLQKYREDTQAVLRIFPDAQVFVVGAPIGRDPGAADHLTRLNQQYERIADHTDHVEFVAAGQAVLDDGRYADALPCLPDEPCTGGYALDGTPINIVRAPDGAHFCPGAPPADQGVTATCTVWSSGAYRFGTAIATAVLTATS